MNILVTVLEKHINEIIPLLSITNPLADNSFDVADEVIRFRISFSLKPIDECWIISAKEKCELLHLEDVEKKYNIKIRIFLFPENSSLQRKIKVLRDKIYRVVLHAKEKADTLYLSADQGIAYGDVQEAANIFGCDAMYCLDNGTPLLIKEKTESNIIISADDDKILASQYPLSYISDSAFRVMELDDNLSLLKEIEIRTNHSKYLYSNYYGMIKSSRQEREIFRKLYYLPQEKLEKLKAYKLGENKSKDLWIIQHLPKAELHSHIGGLLSPSEIIEVALKAINYQVVQDNDYAKKFVENIDIISKYKNNPKDFEKLIYGKYLNKFEFNSIGIDPYQKLGDFQGSGLLQLSETIKATLECYAKHLIQENVKYVEIRCSPYNYTRLGLSIEEVVNIIMDTLDQFSNSFDYRLIYIIGRQGSKEKIKSAIKDYCELYDKNSKFAFRFAGVDLAGNEGVTRPSEIREDFMPLLEKCARVTIHAGETESVDSIWEAVYHLNADRIGHGLKLLDNKILFNRFLDKKIGVEMCPSSNDQIIGFKIGEYPLKQYMEKGLRVTLNTDDCGISRTTLANEFLKAAEMCPNLTLWDCIVLIRNSLCIAFCDEETKSKLMHSFEDEMLEFFNNLF